MTTTLTDIGQTLYIAFQDAEQAERAAGALLDHGLREEDLTVLVDSAGTGELLESESVERAAKSGISVTTPEDASVGAVTGAGIGLGLGILAGLASLFIPGVGLVYGSGALATAIAAAAGTTAAGALAGGVTGYLKDQGIPEQAVRHFANYYQIGGALIELRLPSGTLNAMKAREIVGKYGGANVGAF